MSTATSIRIDFDRSGAGEPLVLVHGVGSRREVFSPVAGLLAAHHDVIALDLPGFGRSPAHPLVDGSIESLAAAVEDLLGRLGIERAHVVGNSLGGAVALELGRRGTALSVTAFAPIGFWGFSGLFWARTAVRTVRALARAARPALPMVGRTARGRAALFGLFYGRPGGLPLERGLGDVDALLAAPGVDAALKAFGRAGLHGAARLHEIPVTVAWGSRDLLLTYATQSRRAAWLMPWADHVTLPGCGHLPFADDPAACLKAVLDTTRGAVPDPSTVQHEVQ